MSVTNEIGSRVQVASLVVLLTCSAVAVLLAASEPPLALLPIAVVFGWTQIGGL